MHAKFIHDGEAIDFRPDYDVAAGTVFTMNNGSQRLAAIAKRDIPTGQLGALALSGVFELPADEGSNFSIGSSAYWNTDTLKAQTQPGQGLEAVFLGLAVSAKLPHPQGGSVVRVLLVPVWSAS